MTSQQIQAKIDELTAKKKEALKQEKAKAQKVAAAASAKKRKLENRVKYIIGGYVLANSPDYVQKLLASEKLREQDKKTLREFLS